MLTLDNSAYMLMGCAFQLFIGRLYTFYSPKKVFLTCIFLFEVGSAICGAAPNSPVFIVGRAVAGLGASGIFGGAIVLTMFIVPLHKRPVFVSLNGAIFGISSVVGPCKTYLVLPLSKIRLQYPAKQFCLQYLAAL
jgi:MFS family permease